MDSSTPQSLTPLDPPEPRSDREIRRRSLLEAQVPYLSMLRSPTTPSRSSGPGRLIDVASYNVHRWTGSTGGRRWSPELACAVVRELDANVIALQEVLRPFDEPDPLLRLVDDLNYHVAFVSTRIHRRGELGNAILSRWPMTGVFTIDLSYGRIERRSAVVAQFRDHEDAVSVVATHLALVDRTRERQVRSILDHRQLQGPVLLLGDMNAWRRCAASRHLEQVFEGQRQDPPRWPATFPSARPVMALDRVYARGGRVTRLRAHDSPAARRGSDHLPVIASVRLDHPA
jgi:endonuclease/exonuclease/phosphatase family metal-dependent hydrolase